MALRTLGTNATTTLQALIAKGNFTVADQATINNGIKNDQINGLPIYPGAWRNDILVIPNRGVLKVFAGDWVGIDSQGWPILVSKNSIANGPWTHS